MRVFVILEAGSNHDSSFERAKKLIDIAVDCGGDAVKFQLIGSFKREWIDPLIEYCGDRIEFMATAFNQNGIDALKGKVKHWKIASSEAADPKFLDAVEKAANGSIVFVSDGAVDDPNTILRKNFIPMACVVEYPADEKDYCFLYKGIWGLSDHTISPFFGAKAVKLGAVAIEKHFTDDPTREGDDHHFSLNPEVLKEYVREIREAERGMFKKTIKDHVGRKIEWS